MELQNVIRRSIERRSKELDLQLLLMKSLFEDKVSAASMETILYEDGWSIGKTVGDHLDQAISNLEGSKWHLDLILEKLS